MLFVHFPSQLQVDVAVAYLYNRAIVANSRFIVVSHKDMLLSTTTNEISIVFKPNECSDIEMFGKSQTFSSFGSYGTKSGGK